jgi:hypothetical protein
MVGGVDFGISYQRACIYSWVTAGFRVVSINSEEEIEILRESDFPVEYISSPSPRPKIIEFLTEARESRSELMGIINADCLLLNYPGFVENILSGAKDGLVIVERINIDPNSLLPTGQSCFGFDALFFNRSDVCKVDIDPNLVVGQPWWDYWLPMEFAISGIKLMRPHWPLIVHLDHDQGWSLTNWSEYGRKCISHFFDVAEAGNSAFSTDLREFVDSESTKPDNLVGFAHWCFNWLRDHADFLKAGPDDSSEVLFARILGAVANFDGMHPSTLALTQARWELSEIAALRDRLQEEKGQLQGERDRLQEEKGQLQGGMGRVQEEKSHLQEERDRLQEEKGHLQEERDLLQEEKGQRQEEMGRLQEEIDQKQVEVCQQQCPKKTLFRRVIEMILRSGQY